MRPQLLAAHKGQWIALHQGSIVASGSNLLSVTDAAAKTDGHPFIVFVGAEDQVQFNVRRVAFPYDMDYQPFPLPKISATFENYSASQSITFSDVIPDTGADLTVLPGEDAAKIDLYSSPYMTAVTRGVAGPSTTNLIFRGWVEINGRRCSAMIQSIPGSQDRMVGRDVLNQLRVTFDGPAAEVIVD
jgi:predicted aspartyl protease